MGLWVRLIDSEVAACASVTRGHFVEEERWDLPRSEVQIWVLRGRAAGGGTLERNPDVGQPGCGACGRAGRKHFQVASGQVVCDGGARVSLGLDSGHYPYGVRPSRRVWASLEFASLHDGCVMKSCPDGLSSAANQMPIQLLPVAVSDCPSGSWNS